MIEAQLWHRRRSLLGLAAALLLLATTAPAAAQRPNGSNQANWPMAERFSAEALRPVIYSGSINPRWVGRTDSMFYNWRDQNGSRYTLVVPRTREKKPLFDHVKMAAQLSELGRKPREAHDLSLDLLSFSEDHRTLRFVVDSVRYEWDVRGEQLRNLGRWTRQQHQMEQQRIQREGMTNPPPLVPPGTQPDWRNWSPDSTQFVFARQHNLFYVDMARGDTLQLTQDGEQWYSFGGGGGGGGGQQQQQQQDDQQDDQQERQEGQQQTRNPGVRANVNWSEDSQAFYITRSDSREVQELYLVHTLPTRANPRPRLQTYRYAMPGDEHVAQQELWAFRRGDTELTRMPVDKWKDQRHFDIHWPVDAGDRLRLVRRDRLQRNLELIEVALPSLDVKVLLTESVEDAFLERQNVRYVRSGGDFIWFSERTGWGHYYLYDHDGRLKNPITTGAWRAEQIAEVDSIGRVAWIRGVGREAGENPYYRHLYRVNLDGSGFALLDAGNAHHNSSLSPSRRFIVSSASRIDMPWHNVLRDANGRVLLELETQDVERLLETGWQPPETFHVKAADGFTDIYGVMWRPFDFDPSRRYPIVAHVYPGPQTESVTSTFSPNANNQRLAQLGFIVVQIGNRGGSPSRSNAYHSYGYYNLRDYGLADKKAGIEQLAARHPWIDIDRVGIYGHSGGGFMTAAALLQPPYNDFFKVGVSSAGNHDNNVYNQNWSEQHHGLREVRRMVTNGNGEEVEEITFEINVPANHELAANLKGRLLITHGEVDSNVHHAGTMRLVDALIKENKRFDMFIFPGVAHGFGGSLGPYWNRMIHEYFAEHLLGDYYRGAAEIR
jgi:dipeptidyl-peptidase 4